MSTLVKLESPRLGRTQGPLPFTNVAKCLDKTWYLLIGTPIDSHPFLLRDPLLDDILRVKLLPLIEIGIFDPSCPYYKPDKVFIERVKIKANAYYS